LFWYRKLFQLNDTEQQLTACKAEVVRLETMVTEKEKNHHNSQNATAA
jgi:hypothetical protein